MLKKKKTSRLSQFVNRIYSLYHFLKYNLGEGILKRHLRSLSDKLSDKKEVNLI